MDVLRFQAINVSAILQIMQFFRAEVHADLSRDVATQSAVDTTFWAELQRLKLGELRLSERPLALQGAPLRTYGPML